MEEIIFYHSPQTRSTGVLVLLEELAAPFTLKLMNSRQGALDTPSYVAVNPMRKVPALQHRGSTVTEQPAVYTYLADLFPEKGLAPGLNDPLRGEYLRWMSFYGSSFEPAIMDKAMKKDSGSFATSPYGDFETMLSTVLGHLEKFGQKGPYWLGEKFTAVDALWGSALGWIIGFGLVPKHPLLREALC
jgi:glutathione S-transferase